MTGVHARKHKAYPASLTQQFGDTIHLPSNCICNTGSGQHGADPSSVGHRAGMFLECLEAKEITWKKTQMNKGEQTN